VSQEDIELLKLQIQREQMRADWLKWFVVFIWPLVVNVGTAYVNHRAIDSVAAKADDAATAAKTATEVAVETKRDQGEKLSAIVGGVDASVKSWKAWQSKEPGDMNAAVEAVDKAAATVPPNP
jgi:hypothetical protein